MLTLATARHAGNIGLPQASVVYRDLVSVLFLDCPDTVKRTILNLAELGQIDTALSLNSQYSYTYQNPGNGKGYMDQVINGQNQHNINGICYSFLIGQRPYILYENEIYSFDQSLPNDCSGVKCIPDTLGINEARIQGFSE
jgi:hypothetical protein